MKRNQFGARLGAVKARAERIMVIGGLISLLALGSIGAYVFGVLRPACNVPINHLYRQDRVAPHKAN